jgi:hypothetical protein
MSGRALRLVGIAAAATGLSLAGALPAASATPGAASAAKPSWRIVKVVGVSGGLSQFVNVSAPAKDNAWVGGFTCGSPCSTQIAAIYHWDGHSWRPRPVPPALVNSPSAPVVSGSSASNVWIFAYGASNREYAAHVVKGRITMTELPAMVNIISAPVFSATNAWAFGVSTAVEPPAGQYGAHFNGQRWKKVTLPLAPSGVSALTSRNIWVYGEALNPVAGRPTAFLMARWTGHGWRKVALPKLHLGTGYFMNPNGIVALSPHNVWVTGTLGKDQGIGDGVVLLHWNGKKWTRVSPRYSLSAFDTDIIADGAGGFWVTGYASRAQHYKGPYLLHYLHGHWSRQLAPTKSGGGAQFGGLALIPGTTQLWGAAELLNGTGSQGVIYKYGR